MSVETCSYRLTLRGRPAGTHTLGTAYRGRTAVLTSQLKLQGPMRNTSLTQQSKVHRQQFFSFSFQETISSPESRSFKVHFDIEEGLVKASRGSKDSASVPYLQAYEDPLGLLYHLRHLGDETHLRVPMLGKDVTVERVGETALDTVLGKQLARVYRLHPGGSYVYVGADAPHPILMMSQRFDGQLLDALLVRISEETEKRREPNRRRRPRRRKRDRSK